MNPQEALIKQRFRSVDERQAAAKHAAANMCHP